MRTIIFRLTTIAIVAGTACAVSGCATTPGGDPGPATSTVELAREQLPDMQSVVDRVESTGGVVVVATAGASREIPGNATPDGTEISKDDPSYVPATGTDLDVSKTIFGDVTPGDTITVRQHGAPSVVLSGLPKMSEGHDYLVFLKPFHYVPDQDTGLWTVVGLDAVWERGSDDEFHLMTAGDDEPRYPETLREADAERLLTD